MVWCLVPPTPAAAAAATAAVPVCVCMCVHSTLGRGGPPVYFIVLLFEMWVHLNVFAFDGIFNSDGANRRAELGVPRCRQTPPDATLTAPVTAVIKPLNTQGRRGSFPPVWLLGAEQGANTA